MAERGLIQKERQKGGLYENIQSCFLAQWQHAASYRKTNKMAACMKLFRAPSWSMAARGLIQKARQNGGLSETIQKLFLANGSTRPDTERQTKWRPV
jgi:hypothetical protein